MCSPVATLIFNTTHDRVLFLGELRGTAAARLLYLAFGGAILLTIASLGAFVTEMLLAGRDVRRAVDRHSGTA